MAGSSSSSPPAPAAPSPNSSRWRCRRSPHDEDVNTRLMSACGYELQDLSQLRFIRKAHSPPELGGMPSRSEGWGGLFKDEQYRLIRSASRMSVRNALRADF